MFPQLVAGPIVRYETVDKQITKRDYSFDKFNSGLERVIKGLFKKVIISNTIGELATLIYSLSYSEMTVATAWLGAIAYTFQIYFDFSGYSDMAIGLGKMLGFDFLENFNYPYVSKSVSEFWRRWHISLGSWFKDYVYIPLGGNKVGTIKLYRNLAIVWVVTGIWHGASWNFILWGIYFGFFIILERIFLGELLRKLPNIIQHIYLMIIVIFGWVLFSQVDINSTVEYIKIMLGLGEYRLFNNHTIFYIKQYWIVIIMSILASIPVLKQIEGIGGLIKLIRPLVVIMSFVLVVIYLVNSTFNPFIYFNF